MIYKDLFKITINGEEYTEDNKQFFTLQEMKQIYLDYRDQNFVATYEPILTEDILYGEIYEDYEREEDSYED